MSITITAAGSDGGSVNLTVQSGIGPVGPNAALIGGSGIDVTYANGEATLDLNATLTTLSDVSAASPTAGQVLAWNGAAWAAADDSANLTGYATESYVDSAVANLVDSSPAALDTLNELAAALGDDPNFSATITASLAGKAAANHSHASSDISDFSAAAAANAPIQSINALTGSVVISNGTGITLTEAGSTLTLNASLPPSNLADLADVSGSPSTNQALIYNGTGWQPGDIPAGTTINGLSGGITLANGTGLTLTESGSTLTLDASLPPSNLADLADVSAASPSVNQTLLWDGSSWSAADSPASTTVDGLSGAIDLVAGGNITITQSGQNITVAASGLQGADGDPANITIGTVSTLSAGSSATATLTGAAPDYTLGFGIPVGDTGAQGQAGPTTNLTIGDVTTGIAGSNATATIAGTPPDLTLNLTIPRGDTGAAGSSGGISLGLLFALT